MSDTIDAAAPPPILPPQQSGPAQSPRLRPADIPPDELIRLVHGLYFIFLGFIAVLSASVELVIVAPSSKTLEQFVNSSIRPFHFFVCGAGIFGILAGSWRLCQVRAPGHNWRLCTRILFVLAVLLAYLFPFFCMWRRLPSNLYLLGHTILWIGVLICHAGLLNLTLGAFGKFAGRSSLVVQSFLFAWITIFLSFIPFVALAHRLVLLAARGIDPVMGFQFLLDHLPPLITLGLLLPFSLTLSLVWAAKDVALLWQPHGIDPS